MPIAPCNSKKKLRIYSRQYETVKQVFKEICTDQVIEVKTMELTAKLMEPSFTYESL